MAGDAFLNTSSGLSATIKLKSIDRVDNLHSQSMIAVKRIFAWLSQVVDINMMHKLSTLRRLQVQYLDRLAIIAVVAAGGWLKAHLLPNNSCFPFWNALSFLYSTLSGDPCLHLSSFGYIGHKIGCKGHQYAWWYILLPKCLVCGYIEVSESLCLSIVVLSSTLNAHS